jgi:hypothetical protein
VNFEAGDFTSHRKVSGATLSFKRSKIQPRSISMHGSLFVLARENLRDISSLPSETFESPEARFHENDQKWQTIEK